MASSIFVLLGAGASYDAIPGAAPSDRPPLTRDLFSHSRADRLAKYPLALNVAPQIEDAVGGDEPAESLEDFLRNRLADSQDPYDQRRLLSIELYLQDLLLSFADQGNAAANYRRLVSPLLAEFDHVHFVTLNYDILLDQCLRAFEPLDTIDDFITHERWSLVKPHGSVTWTREVPITIDGERIGASWRRFLESPPAHLRDVLGNDIDHQWATDVDALRDPRGEPNVLARFPAISAPLGPGDTLSCPPRHLNFLADRLESQGQFDLLVIGYSGLDDAVLGLLSGTSATPRSVYVVDSGFEGARDAATRLADAFDDRLTIRQFSRPGEHEPNYQLKGKDHIFWHASKRSFGFWISNKGLPEYLKFLEFVKSGG